MPEIENVNKVGEITKGVVVATSSSGLATHVAVAPTQVRRPWRSTLRTVFQALVALAAMMPVLVAATGLKVEQAPWLVGVLAVAAAVTRVMSLPVVEAFLRRFLPWLAAAPKQ